MRVFLSSTYCDLVEHRQAATDALERLGQQVGRMEIFGARSEEPLNACVSEIDACDLFVGIYAHRYGHVLPSSQYSITEQEFRQALEQKKPLFCYLVDDKYDWPPQFIESEPGLSKLLAFKSTIKESLVVDFFSEPLDLAVKIATAVGHHLIHNQSLLAVSTRDKRESEQREQIIALLEARKDKILEEFSGDSASKRHFLLLHARNIEAIRNGELLLSHLLTSDIHSLIYSVLLDKQERKRKEEARKKRQDAPMPATCLSDEPPREYRTNVNVTPWYPYDTQSSEQHWHNAWSNASGWYFRPRAPRATAADRANIESNSWRGRLLSDWLELELQPLWKALEVSRWKVAHDRKVAALERDADARAVMKAGLRRGSRVACPYCFESFGILGKAGEQVRCAYCRTRLELVEFAEYVELVKTLPPRDYRGHLIINELDDVCIKCGCSVPAIKSLRLKCV